MKPYPEDVTHITVGPKGAILHVNRQHIALNVKDGGNRPVYTIKPDGPNSKPIYAREVTWEGETRAIYNGTKLACGARAWLWIAEGTILSLSDAMPHNEAKAAA